jgi:hypothetical protein
LSETVVVRPLIILLSLSKTRSLRPLIMSGEW